MYPLVEECAGKAVLLAKKRNIDIYVQCGDRTPEENLAIYKTNKWSWHLVGLAVDFYPVLKVKPKEWQDCFNNWPHWEILQKEVFVEAGFDNPQKFQLGWDRPHAQKLFGLSGSLMRTIYETNYKFKIKTLSPKEAHKHSVEQVHSYINLHI